LGRNDMEVIPRGDRQRWTRFVRPDDAPAVKGK